MIHQSSITNHRSKRAPCRRSEDLSTIKNPHARPRHGCRPAVPIADPPELVDRTMEGYEPRLLVQTSELLGFDNMARWVLVYRCRYGSGREDRELHERHFIAATRAGAIDQLRRRMVGFDVDVIELFGVRAPLTRDQVAAVNAANEELEAARRKLGLWTGGVERAANIEEWLKRRSDGSVRSVGSDGSTK